MVLKQANVALREKVSAREWGNTWAQWECSVLFMLIVIPDWMTAGTSLSIIKNESNEPRIYISLTYRRDYFVSLKWISASCFGSSWGPHSRCFDIEWARSCENTTALPATFYTLWCGGFSSAGNQTLHGGRTCWSVSPCGAATATSSPWTSGTVTWKQSRMKSSVTVAPWRNFSSIPTNSKSYQRYVEILWAKMWFEWSVITGKRIRPNCITPPAHT